uniref:Uncharacterized protein n=1 Tax=Nelumbo nucifera TaxID=4432 RepID=A0A822YBP0_NELNU|nr:TPA_asm: hypothetical protein HUJ06_031200 [Nelumbo nucifera]
MTLAHFSHRRLSHRHLHILHWHVGIRHDVEEQQRWHLLIGYGDSGGSSGVSASMESHVSMLITMPLDNIKMRHETKGFGCRGEQRNPQGFPTREVLGGGREGTNVPSSVEADLGDSADVGDYAVASEPTSKPLTISLLVLAWGKCGASTVHRKPSYSWQLIHLLYSLSKPRPQKEPRSEYLLDSISLDPIRNSDLQGTEI